MNGQRRFLLTRIYCVAMEAHMFYEALEWIRTPFFWNLSKRRPSIPAKISIQKKHTTTTSANKNKLLKRPPSDAILATRNSPLYKSI